MKNKHVITPLPNGSGCKGRPPSRNPPQATTTGRAPLPQLIPSFDMDNSSSSSSVSPLARDVSDSNILKGAEIIRAQIQHQRDSDEIDRLVHAVAVSSSPKYKQDGSVGIHTGVKHGEEEEWSDPWRPKCRLTDQISHGDLSTAVDHSHPSDESGDHLFDHHSNFSSRGDPAEWAQAQNNEIKSEEQAIPPPPSPDGTPITLMGRGKSLKLKIHTYHVQRTDEIGDDDTYDDSLEEGGDFGLYGVHRDRAIEDLVEQGVGGTYIPARWQIPRPRTPPPQEKPIGPNLKLLKDPAYQHARRAGQLWQSLVGQHVRFPKTWWDGARSPPLGMLDEVRIEGKSTCQWQYLGRHRVRPNHLLSRAVKNRASGGRLLLHLVVCDLVTRSPVQDVAVGAFHPNARGIRTTEKANVGDEKFRDVWIAVRKRTRDGAVSVVDPFLAKGHPVQRVATYSPLGKGPRITNTNMRAVFGEKPPFRTAFIVESELYERMTLSTKNSLAPALILLEEFVTF